MPLAGRLADLWGARRLFMGALTVFVVGSALAGASQNLDQLIAARLVQGVGGGVLVPVGHGRRVAPVRGPRRPRALGVIGALTFLGMAAGPFVGAAILGGVHVEGTVERLGLEGTTLAAVLAPAWRWIFYVNVPIGIVAIALAWAASAGWETPRRAGRVDVVGASLFTVALASGLIGLTLLGSSDIAGLAVDPAVVSAVLFAVAAVATVLTILRDLRQETPFLEVRLFRERVVQLGGPGLAADRLRVRDRDHRRRRVRRPRAVRRARRPAARARRARRIDGRGGTGVGFRRAPPVACGS